MPSGKPLQELPKCNRCKCNITSKIPQCSAYGCWDLSNKTCQKCLSAEGLLPERDIIIPADPLDSLDIGGTKLLFLCKVCKRKNRKLMIDRAKEHAKVNQLVKASINKNVK